VSNPATAKVNIDKTPPVAAATLSPAPNASGWNNGTVTVSFTSTDSLSGIDFCSAPITLTSDGSGQIATGTCTDKAGNVSVPVTAKVNVDKTPPVAAATLSPAPDASGWNNGTVTVSFTGTDSLSGIDSCSAPVTLTSDGAAPNRHRHLHRQGGKRQRSSHSQGQYRQDATGGCCHAVSNSQREGLEQH